MKQAMKNQIRVEETSIIRQEHSCFKPRRESPSLTFIKKNTKRLIRDRLAYLELLETSYDETSHEKSNLCRRSKYHQIRTPMLQTTQRIS